MRGEDGAAEECMQVVRTRCGHVIMLTVVTAIAEPPDLGTAPSVEQRINV